MIVKNFNDTTIDVFTGKGWDEWSRFHVSFVKDRLFLKLVKGRPMSKENFSTLYKSLVK